MNKTLRALLLLLLAFALLGGGFAGGFLAGHVYTLNSRTPGVTSAPAPAVTTTGDSDETATLFAPFWQTWDLVHSDYVDQPVDDTLLMQGAIRGMLESLGDPHTAYMTPAETTQMNMRMSGEYDGIGAWVDTGSEYLTIVSPMPDSPAEKAGLRPGDQILKVDGEDMTGIPGDLVISRVLGPAGTTVVLTIRREGVAEPFDVAVVRAHIVVKSVEGKMLENGIAYVKINTFGENTGKELRAMLSSLLSQKPRGLILDLRNNGGGYLFSAVEVASQFLKQGVVLIEKYGDGTSQTYQVQRGGLATDIPMVVLVNEGTASASEIVAGALQDYGRAKLVGVVTYGKGSVQQPVDLVNNQGSVRITIAKWLTPNGRAIHGVGLTPDVNVEMSAEDYDAGRDPQLDRAVQVLLESLR